MQHRQHRRTVERAKTLAVLFLAVTGAAFALPLAGFSLPVAKACCDSTPWSPSGPEQQFINDVHAMGFNGQGGFDRNIVSAGYILCDMLNHYAQQGLGPQQGLVNQMLSGQRSGSGAPTSDQLRQVMRWATTDLCPAGF